MATTTAPPPFPLPPPLPPLVDRPRSAPSLPASGGLSPLPLRCRRCGATSAPAPTAICEDCLGPLEPVYDADRALPQRDRIERRPPSLWRYREWLPFTGDPTRLAGHRIHTARRCTGARPRARSRPGVGQERQRVASRRCRSRTASWRRRSTRPSRLASTPSAAHRRAIWPMRSPRRPRAPASPRGSSSHTISSWARSSARWCTAPTRPRAWHVRRRQPTVRAGRRPIRVGHRERQPAELLRRRVEDRRVRDRGAARVALPHGGHRTDGRRVARDQAAKGVQRVPGWRDWRPALHPDCTAPKPRDAGRSRASSSPEATDSTPEIPHTIARSIAIGNPADGATAAAALRDSHGWAAAVSDEALVARHPPAGRNHRHLHRNGRRRRPSPPRSQLARAGRLTPDDELVVCITGHGLKTVEALHGALPDAPLIAPRLRDVEALVQERAQSPVPNSRQ